MEVVTLSMNVALRVLVSLPVIALVTGAVGCGSSATSPIALGRDQGRHDPGHGAARCRRLQRGAERVLHRGRDDNSVLASKIKVEDGGDDAHEDDGDN
jgi:hypothetical protein